jgi:Caspase domain
MKHFALVMVMIGGLAHAQPQPSRGVLPAQQIPARTNALEKLRRGKNYALLIGTDKYDDPSWSRLANPVKDARDMEAVLKKDYGYVTDFMEDPTYSDVRLRLTQYVESRSFGPDDKLLIYIAGHGKYVEAVDEGYLAFRDSKDLAKDASRETYMDYAYLTRMVNKMGAKHILLVVDACRSGTIEGAISTRGAADPYPTATTAEAIARNADANTRMYMTSGANEDVPDGNKDQNSPFAYRILDTLKRNNDVLTADALWANARLVTTSPKTGKWGKNDPGSEYWFVPNSIVQSAAPAAAPPTSLSASVTRGNQAPPPTAVPVSNSNTGQPVAARPARNIPRNAQGQAIFSPAPERRVWCEVRPSMSLFQRAQGFEIVELPGSSQIVISSLNGPRRVIQMNAPPLPASVQPTPYGHSIGFREGDMLVIDTVGFNEKFLTREGIPSSRKLHLIERFTRTGYYSVRYEAMIDDPGAYNMPWTVGWDMDWSAEPCN